MAPRLPTPAGRAALISGRRGPAASLADSDAGRPGRRGDR